MHNTAKCLLLFFCLARFLNPASGQGKASKAENMDACVQAKRRALTDHKHRQLKYYAFGIAAPSRHFIDSLRHYHVKTISLGCTAGQEVMCYNAIVDSILFNLYKVDIHKMR